MHNTIVKLILLDYNNFEYVEKFKSYFIYDKLCASVVNIHDFIQYYHLTIPNYNTITFYMNLLNFGGFCDWKVKYNNSLENMKFFNSQIQNHPKVHDISQISYDYKNSQILNHHFNNQLQKHPEFSDIIQLHYSFKKLQWITFYRNI